MNRYFNWNGDATWWFYGCDMVVFMDATGVVVSMRCGKRCRGANALWKTLSGSECEVHRDFKARGM